MKTIDEYSNLIGMMDTAFSSLHLINPTENECVEADIRIWLTMRLWRGLDLSGTPKAHMFEGHAVEQMRMFNSIAEDFMEQGHQEGFQEQRCTDKIFNFQKQHNIAQKECIHWPQSGSAAMHTGSAAKQEAESSK